MKIFITGGSGLLGQFLNLELSRKHEILTQYFSNIGNCKNYNSVKVGLNNKTELAEIITNFKPDVIVHTGAISNSDRADKVTPGYVNDINVKATKQIAELCNQLNAKLIYTSTDLVYAGYRGSLLKEDSKLIPISLYAESKLMGEVKIQQTFDNHIILRTALQYGFGLNHSRTHFQFVYEQLKNGNKVKLFTDQYRSVASVRDSARMISELVELEVNGIFNFGGTSRLSRYDLGIALCNQCGFDKELVTATTMKEVNASYIVEDVSMNVDKLASIGIESLPFEIALKKELESAGY